ncbi:MAG TPA: GYD domain-containing protein [Gemmatimonadaceae bacterium]|nr:GYD domain-containing protein [Gemmatimonadaceae bacterium]
MATYLMFGKYSLEAIGKISAQRSDQAIALIKQNGGELKAGYALLGDTDLALIVELPDTERAMKTSVGLSKLLGVSFSTVPAVTVAEFDKLLA